MKTARVSSGFRPPEIDEASSPHTVYVRSDITETVMQSENGENQSWWEYTERHCGYTRRNLPPTRQRSKSCG